MILASSLTFSITANAAPFNDNWASASTLGIPNGVISDNLGATFESGEPQPCGPILATVWYKFVPPTTGEVVVTTISDQSNFDTVLAVYIGDSLPGLTNVGCNDDIVLSRRSALWLSVSSANTYYIQVGGYAGLQGTFQLQISYRKVTDSRSCSGPVPSWLSNACRGLDFGEVQHDGFQAQWASNALNISQDGATSGGFIEQAIWFYDTGGSEARWLEMGDTAGTGQMQGHEDAWERWWFWVDRTTSTYIEHGIDVSLNDGLWRFYIIQWDGASNGWGLYICPGACIREGSTPWIAPTSMGNQTEIIGLESQNRMLNTNTNSAPVQVSGIRYRSTLNGMWSAWPGANWQIDAGCSQYLTNYCLNGIWLSGPPPYDNWRNNKP